MPNGQDWNSKNVEVIIKTEGRLSGLENEIKHLAKTSDVEKLKWGLLYWLVPTIIASIGAFAGLLKFVCQ